MSEERTDKRADFETTLRLRSPTSADYEERTTGNVSSTGLFVRIDEPMRKSTLLKLELEIDGEMVKAVGRVVWTRPPEHAGLDKPAGMGIKFVKINDAAKRRIAELVEEHGGEAPSTFERGPGSIPPKGVVKDEAEAEAPAEMGAESDSETETESEPESETGPEGGAETDSESETDPEGGAETETEGGADSDSETDADDGGAKQVGAGRRKKKTKRQRREEARERKKKKQREKAAARQSAGGREERVSEERDDDEARPAKKKKAKKTKSETEPKSAAKSKPKSPQSPPSTDAEGGSHSGQGALGPSFWPLLVVLAVLALGAVWYLFLR